MTKSKALMLKPGDAVVFFITAPTRRFVGHPCLHTTAMSAASLRPAGCLSSSHRGKIARLGRRCGSATT